MNVVVVDRAHLRFISTLEHASGNQVEVENEGDYEQE